MSNTKRIILFILFLTNLFYSISYSQTTLEEYNYITKGYKIQVESGLDMKKGYTLIDLGSWGLESAPALFETKTQHRECTFKGLVREGEDKPCAIMMIYKRTDKANTTPTYYCIPTIDSKEFFQKTLEQIVYDSKENIPMTNTIIWALMKFSSQEVSK